MILSTLRILYEKLQLPRTYMANDDLNITVKNNNENIKIIVGR